MPRTKLGERVKAQKRQPIIELILGRLAVSDVSKAELAKGLDISVSQLNNRFRLWKQDNWPYGDLVKMCRILDISPEDFQQAIKF